jgi:DNA-binding response OmpR family regulator
VAEIILVADDEQDVVELLSFNLRKEGYEVVGANAGGEALRKALELRPRLILLDVLLPEIDGFGLCEHLRAQEPTARVPIILLTAFASEQARVIGLECGADDYVTKPFSPREVVLRVRRLLERTQAPPKPPPPAADPAPAPSIEVPEPALTINGRRVRVTSAEFKLLHSLAESILARESVQAAPVEEVALNARGRDQTVTGP